MVSLFQACLFPTLPGYKYAYSSLAIAVLQLFTIVQHYFFDYQYSFCLDQMPYAKAILFLTLYHATFLTLADSTQIYFSLDQSKDPGLGTNPSAQGATSAVTLGSGPNGWALPYNSIFDSENHYHSADLPQSGRLVE